MDNTVVMKVEQILEKTVLAEEFISGNPIYKLMREKANQYFDREDWVPDVTFQFLYILDYRINAYTLTFENRAVICFTTGVIEQITHLFSNMVDSEEYQVIFENEDTPKLIANLSVNLFHFLFLHEFAHLVYGHTRYLSSANNPAFMSMFDTVTGSNIIDRQTLELHADIIASQYFGLVVRNDDSSLDKRRLTIALSAIQVLFEVTFLFDRGRYIENSLYLPSTFRLTNAVGIILREQYDIVESIYKEVFEATAKGFYHIFRIKSDSTQTLKKIPKIEGHVKLLESRWRELYKKLERLSTAKLSADIYDWI